MNGRPQISVAICTRNRVTSLQRTLDSLAAMTPPAGLSWELLVVDNGSTDGTWEMLGAERGRLPLRAVRHAEKGLSRARNRAVAEARGDWIVWTDDDVRVAPQWLGEYARAIAAHPELAVLGGPIEPELEPPARRWMQDNLHVLRHALAARDFGPAPVALSASEDRLPFGANFAVRATEQRAARYDEMLGAGSGGASIGEETALLRALFSQGARGLWVPGARVRHMIPPERQSRAYVFDYYAGHGAADARTTWHRAGPPWWLLRRIATHGLHYAARRLLPFGHGWVEPLIRYAYHRGYWRGLRAARADKTSAARPDAATPKGGAPPGWRTE